MAWFALIDSRILCREFGHGDLFLTREEAEWALADVLKDEPQLEPFLSVWRRCHWRIRRRTNVSRRSVHRRPHRMSSLGQLAHENMRSMGAAGSPYAAFRRAIEARNLTRAFTEARDLPQISLVDAAELVVLAAEQHGPSFERWAGRWAARYALEEANVTLDEAQLLLAGLGGLRQPDRHMSALVLIAVFAARNRPDLERPFRRLLKSA